MAKLFLMQILLVACWVNIIVSAKPLEEEDEELDQIIGGTAAPKGSYQYFVSLRMVTASNQVSMCGATVISSKTILTAAHCVDGGPYSYVQLIFRTWNISPLDPSYQVWNYNSPTIRIHGAWNRTMLKNDIALIILPVSLPLYAPYQETTGNVYWLDQVKRPTCNATFEGATSTAIGYGRLSTGGITSTTLQHVNLKVLSDAECVNRWKTTANYNISPESQVCAGLPGKSVCSGDSGGPLLVDKYQVGITSFVHSGGCELYGGVFTRVAYYKNWIESNWVP